jgi:hypothetical protein
MLARSQLRTTKQYVVEPLSQNRRLIAQIYPHQQTQDREQDYNEFLPFFAAGYSLKQCFNLSYCTPISSRTLPSLATITSSQAFATESG